MEKRYKSNTYIQCYCSKREEILGGMKLYLFMSIFFIPVVAVAYGYTLMLDIPIVIKIAITACIALAILSSEWPDYLKAKKKMLQRGHSEYCSRRVALLVMLHAGIWSDFKIMKNKEN